jgi:hypothetical protein
VQGNGSNGGTVTITATDNGVTGSTMVINGTPSLGISPPSASVAVNATQQFTANGGQGPYAWSLASNQSGGSIGAGSGLYTAGSTSSVVDVVKVTDSLGATKTANVNVTP